MNMQPRHLARRTTALLSTIAASGLLGLPALAGGLPVGPTNTNNSQAQAPSSSDQMQCVPGTQANAPSATAAPDASASSAAQLPNQSDPRAGLSPSNQTVVSSANSDSTNSASNVPMSGSYTSSGNNNSSDQNRSYGNVLAQGGATSGGFASQQVWAANNPDAYRTVSSRISSNEERPNFIGTTAGSMGSGTSASSSMSSSATSQPYSQSSQSTTSTTIAQCPNGMTPQSTTPSMRQAPGQDGSSSQPSMQQSSPQPTTGNQTPQSPADDNSGRTR
ncbi:MAG: hypothetical protein ACAF41_09415 [Leptolyngbya sp. BL-A-14]